jgi:hypothetical protein
MVATTCQAYEVPTVARITVNRLLLMIQNSRACLMNKRATTWVMKKCVKA